MLSRTRSLVALTACGHGAVCAQDTLLARWCSVLSMGALLYMDTTTLGLPPQTPHFRTLMLLLPRLHGPIEYLFE